MKLLTTLHTFLFFMGTMLLLVGCSGKGPDVADPNSGVRNQTLMMAIEASGGSEILRYNESAGVLSSTAYADANATPLNKSIDGMYESSDRLYLHHRANGSISVLNVRTREELGRVSGFPASADSGLCGMAFSNLSQAWVVCYNRQQLYLVDAVNLVIADSITLPGNPTSVGTHGTKIFVGMELPDGTGQVAVLSSNSGSYGIEQTLNFPSPIIMAMQNADVAEMILLSSGGTDQPKVYYLNAAAPFNTIYEVALPSAALTTYKGQQPTFAGVTRNFYLYLATPNGIFRVDTRSRAEVVLWVAGSYRVMGVDPWTDLLYSVVPDQPTIVRVTITESLPSFTLPSKVSAILFISANKAQ